MYLMNEWKFHTLYLPYCFPRTTFLPNCSLTNETNDWCTIWKVNIFTTSYMSPSSEKILPFFCGESLFGEIKSNMIFSTHVTAEKLWMCAHGFKTAFYCTTVWYFVEKTTVKNWIICYCSWPFRSLWVYEQKLLTAQAQLAAHSLPLAWPWTLRLCCAALSWKERSWRSVRISTRQ